jgi:hypothetical protein
MLPSSSVPTVLLVISCRSIGDGWGWSWFDAGNPSKTTSTD